MKLTDRPHWKRIIIAMLCLIGLLTVTGRSFAAYSSQAYQRGVARNRDTETVRFTSNYLQTYTNGADSRNFTGRTIYFGDNSISTDKLQINLDIYNYANGNENLVSQKDIAYDVTISFAGGGGTGYGVTCEGATVEQSGATYTIKNQILTGRKANSHRYTLTFPGSDLDKLKITAAAVPQNASVTNNQMLAAVLVPCTGTSTNTFSYSGEFIDESATTKPTEYSGFNYEISITSGTATGTLTWNPAILEIDIFFLKNLGKTDEEINQILNMDQPKVQLTMDQPNGTGDYLIPFYIKDKSKIHDNWETMKNYISFTAEQNQN